jgi:hypothetical protein
MYWADPKRGAVLRLAGDGINDIASMGMEDFFIDKFLNSYSEFQLGAYDPYTNKYVLTANADETLTFSDQIKGWTSRHSFIPEFMIGINNEFYSFYQGQLWRHHSDNVPRNNFYGVQYDSTLSFVINQEPQTIKELQALSLQGNVAWDVDLEAFVDMSDNTINSSISSSEFNKKEGYWYAYTRRNESPSQLDSKAVYGLGEVTATDIISLPAIITITGYNQSLTEGDVIVNATDGTIAGTVVSSVTTGNTTVISVSGIGTTVIGDFVYGRKNGRIEGSKLRGYGIRANMTNSNTDKTELFAVVSDISKSYT